METSSERERWFSTCVFVYTCIECRKGTDLPLRDGNGHERLKQCQEDHTKEKREKNEWISV